jgi:hypothetical protein
MPPMSAERQFRSHSFLGMETPQDYRNFADECLRLAKQTNIAEHRTILEQMAQVWLRLANEAELRLANETGRKGSR